MHEQTDSRFTCRISFNSIKFISLLYLALSVLLFIWGWVEPIISIPVSLILIAAVCLTFRSMNNASNTESWVLTTWDILQLISIFALLLAGLYRTGLVGGVPTHSDYAGFRCALYHNLIDAPWPVVLPDGKEMTYYLSGLLFPALLSRLTDSFICQQWILMIWSIIPVFLACLLVFCKLKQVNWIFFVLGIFFHVDYIFELPLIKPLHSCFHDFCLRYGEIPPLLAVSRCYAWATNNPALLACSAPMLVGMLILLMKEVEIYLVPLCMAMLVFISPMGAVGLFPLAAICYLRHYKHLLNFTTKSISYLLLSCLLASIAAIYFLRSDGEHFVGFTISNWGIAAWLVNYIPTQILLLFLYAAILRYHKHNTQMWSVFISISLCPVFFIGSRAAGIFPGLNELWLKSAPAYLLMLAYFTATSWNALPKYIRYFWLYISLVTMYGVAEYCIRTYDSAKRGIVTDVLNGHLYHPGNPYLNQSVPGCTPPVLDGVIMREGGKAERVFPGVLLPKAPGCDYGSSIPLDSNKNS